MTFFGDEYGLSQELQNHLFSSSFHLPCLSLKNKWTISSMFLAALAVAAALILMGCVNSGPLLPTPQTSLLGTPQMVSIEFFNNDL